MLQARTFKVLLRRNFDVMFITKNHVYQLIKEDCNEDFLPTNWKKLALKSYFFASAIVNITVMVKFLGLGQFSSPIY